MLDPSLSADIDDSSPRYWIIGAAVGTLIIFLLFSWLGDNMSYRESEIAHTRLCTGKGVYKCVAYMCVSMCVCEWECLCVVICNRGGVAI